MQYILTEEEFKAYQEAMKLKEDYLDLVNALNDAEGRVQKLTLEKINLRNEITKLKGVLKDIQGMAKKITSFEPFDWSGTPSSDLDALAALKAKMNEDGTITRY